MEKTRLEELQVRLKNIRQEIEEEVDNLLDKKREQFQYQIQRGKIVFEQKSKQRHRNDRTPLLDYIKDAPIATILSAPIIYGMVIPLVFLDLTITLYQHICFRIYKIPLVRRRDFFYIDRHYLPYLNLIEKLNCAYCGYGNGLIEYAREVIGRTEKYWCPIKHARRTPDPHRYVEEFFDYGDGEAWKNNLQKIRRDWKEEKEE